MANEIISYIEMCRRGGASLQRGMNFGLRQSYSVILMSVRSNAPYRDRLEDEGTMLIYEGHDATRCESAPNPKVIDQPLKHSTGPLTQNGRFFDAAIAYKSGTRRPALVKVYEKIMQGIWSYNGLFQLIDAWIERDEYRSVCKFKLLSVDGDEEANPEVEHGTKRRRIIPSSVKMEVWMRDNGRCVMCGAEDELHFDHDLPYSKGGTSLKAENVQLLCARHNLSKGNKLI